MQRASGSERILGERRYEAIEAVLGDICAASGKVIMHSLSSVLKDRDVDELIKRGMMPYIYAAGFLSFAGREINWANLSAMVSSLGILPDGRIISLFIGSGVRSHLIYLYSFYFLLANGIEPSKERISSVVNSLGIAVDPVALGEVIEFLKRNERFTRI